VQKLISNQQLGTSQSNTAQRSRLQEFSITQLVQSYQLRSFPNLSLVAACDRLVLNIFWKPVQILRQSMAKVCILLEGPLGSFFINNGRHEPQHHSLPGILLTCQSWNFLLRYTSVFLYQLILSAFISCMVCIEGIKLKIFRE
jgi:hypothetical protein